MTQKHNTIRNRSRRYETISVYHTQTEKRRYGAKAFAIREPGENMKPTPWRNDASRVKKKTKRYQRRDA